MLQERTLTNALIGYADRNADDVNVTPKQLRRMTFEENHLLLTQRFHVI